MKKINAFDWKQGFSEILKQGGFDVVIGNPPYLGGREWKQENGNQYEYFIQKYQIAEYQFDMYVLFWEQGIQLAKEQGYIGYITPNTWLNNKSNGKLRSYILKNTTIEQIVDYSAIKVFHQAVVLPIITVLNKVLKPRAKADIYLPGTESNVSLLHSISQSLWYDGEHNIININLNEKDVEIKRKIEAKSVELETISDVKFGIKLYETGKGTPPQKPEAAKNKIFESNKKLDKSYRPYLEGKDINTFTVLWRNRWLKYGQNLAAPRKSDLFEGERLLVRRIVGERLIATYTESDYVTSQLLQIVKPFDPENAKYVLGILNSKLIAYYFRKKYNRP